MDVLWGRGGKEGEHHTMDKENLALRGQGGQIPEGHDQSKGARPIKISIRQRKGREP